MIRYRRSYVPELICFGIVMMVCLIACWCMAETFGLVDIVPGDSINANGEPLMKFELPGHMWTDGLWRVDFKQALVEPHDFYLFVALNLRYKDDDNAKLMWLEPVWHEKGGWQPGPRPQLYPDRFDPVRRPCCLGERCTEVDTWEFDNGNRLD